MIEEWLLTLEQYAASGFSFFPLDNLDLSVRGIEERVGTPLPSSVKEFCRAYELAGGDLWQTLLASATASNLGSYVSLPALAPLRAILRRAEQGALVWDQRFAWGSPDQWGYLCSIRSGHVPSSSSNFLFHLPATVGGLQAAERVIGMAFPAGYRSLLTVTNGLGIGVQDLSCVFGAGPQRTNWDMVLHGDWLHVDHAREIASAWRAFCGVYAEDEALDDVARSLLDRRVLVPFAQTYERWCFDLSAPRTHGEYPICMWDHELCRAQYRYISFADWLHREFEPYAFGEG